MYSFFCCCHKTQAYEAALRAPLLSESNTETEHESSFLPPAPPSSPRTDLGIDKKCQNLLDDIIHRCRSPLTIYLFLKITNEIIAPLKAGKHRKASQKFCAMFHTTPDVFEKICEKHDIHCHKIYTEHKILSIKI